MLYVFITIIQTNLINIMYKCFKGSIFVFHLKFKKCKQKQQITFTIFIIIF